MLKRRTELTHYVDYSDLETYIEECYGQKVEIAAMEEVGNDTTLSFNIDGEGYSWDTEKFEAFMRGEFVPFGTRVILRQLYIDGLIPSGCYVVEVSW
jgi:hypothetical protein